MIAGKGGQHRSFYLHVGVGLVLLNLLHIPVPLYFIKWATVLPILFPTPITARTIFIIIAFPLLSFPLLSFPLILLIAGNVNVINIKIAHDIFAYAINLIDNIIAVATVHFFDLV